MPRDFVPLVCRIFVQCNITVTQFLQNVKRRKTKTPNDVKNKTNKRFKKLSDDDKATIVNQLPEKNTQKTTQCSFILFQQWLKESDHDDDDDIESIDFKTDLLE